MSSIVAMQDDKLLEKRCRRLLREQEVQLSEKKIQQVGTALKDCIVLMCKLNMRWSKDTVVLGNLRLEYQDQSDPNGSDPPGVRSHFRVRLIEDLPGQAMLHGDKEILVFGGTRSSKELALDAFMEDVLSGLKEKQGWYATQEAAGQAPIIREQPVVKGAAKQKKGKERESRKEEDADDEYVDGRGILPRK